MSTKLLILSIVGALTVAGGAATGYTMLRHRPETPAPSAAVEPSAVGTTAAVVDPPASAAPASLDSPAPAAETAPVSAPPAPVVTSRRPESKTDKSSRQITPSASAARPGTSRTDASAPAPSAAVSDPAPEVKDSKSDPVTPAPEPAKPKFEELTVKEEVIGIRLDSKVSTETAKVEDRVTARVARDVMVDGRTAIPSGAKLEGVVTLVERGGKFKDRARLGIRFNSLSLTDGTRIPIQTETIFRDGESPTGPAASKVGASAVVGTILGAVIGGKKGAVIGATAGAAGGTAAVMASNQSEAVLEAGTPLTVRLTTPVTVSIERENR